MGAEPVILSHAELPAADDPELLHLLALFAEITTATWAVLQLESDGPGERREIVYGTPQGTGVTIDIEAPASLAITLNLGCAETPNEAFLRLFSFTLAKVLHCGRLREQATLLRGALDATSSAVLMFDLSGDIVYANPPADRLLSRQTEDGLMVVENGSPPKPLFTFLCSLVEALAARSETSAAWRGTLALSDGSVLSCEIMRTPTDPHSGETGVLAHLQTVQSVPGQCVEAFAACNRLSRREEEVLRLLLEGLSTARISERLGISPHTVRDHLKNIYRKTGSRSRNELLNRISHATSVPPF